MRPRFLSFIAAASFLAGCGGSGDNPTTVNPPVENAYAGDYESSLSLDGGKRGALTLTVEADGEAAGALTFGAISGAPISGAAFPSNPYVVMTTVNGYAAATILPSPTDKSRSFGLMIAASVQTGQSVAVDPTGVGDVFYKSLCDLDGAAAPHPALA
ncbi:MAG: hypothetical protein ACO1SV_26245 [Fimbriimonas sp.]